MQVHGGRCLSGGIAPRAFIGHLAIFRVSSVGPFTHPDPNYWSFFFFFFYVSCAFIWSEQRSLGPLIGNPQFIRGE